mmetsp:Transcript_8329/g.19425  ORF Transcript_8329/g.19425 Transcript_8329/m.19425 type:complete len:132 (-) Transcript_8329:97-492(-)
MILQLRNERDRIRREIALQAYQESQLKRRQRNSMRHHFAMVKRSTAGTDRAAAGVGAGEVRLELSSLTAAAVEPEENGPKRSRSTITKLTRKSFGLQPVSRRAKALDFVNREDNYSGLVELRSRGAFRNVL